MKQETEQSEVICPQCGTTETELEKQDSYFLGSCFEYICPVCGCNFIERDSDLDNPELFHNY